MMNSLKNQHLQAIALELLRNPNSREDLKNVIATNSTTATMACRETERLMERPCQGDNDIAHYAFEDNLYGDVLHFIEQAVQMALLS